MRRNKMKKQPATTLPHASTQLLAIEASANQLSIAVMVDGEVVAARQHLAAHGHVVDIVPLSIQTVKDAGMTFEAMTHVVAGCGPGSFTGIRVALAAAKGFCMAHKATGVGVSGLQALAHAATHVAPVATTPCLVLADTRRGPLYAQIFDATAQPMGKIFEAPIQQLPYLIETKIAGSDLRVVGTERMAVANALTMAGINAAFPDIDETPSATMVAHLANTQIIQNQTGPLHPLYLADPRLGPKKKSG
jgi:tRNA threonylcarbamoyladenosine biosynthesis protein TsaB